MMRHKSNKTMKNKLKYTVILLSVCYIQACAVVKKSASADMVFISKNNVVVKPQIADLKIEERRVEGSAEIRTQDYYSALDPGYALEACKMLALKNATKNGNCDLLVQPMYESEENALFIKVKVIGFAARYKNFRDISAADTVTFNTLNRINSVISVEVASPKGTILRR
jgi:hypothetical protein